MGCGCGCECVCWCLSKKTMLSIIVAQSFEINIYVIVHKVFFSKLTLFGAWNCCAIIDACFKKCPKKQIVIVVIARQQVTHLTEQNPILLQRQTHEFARVIASAEMPKHFIKDRERERQKDSETNTRIIEDRLSPSSFFHSTSFWLARVDRNWVNTWNLMWCVAKYIACTVR